MESLLTLVNEIRLSETYFIIFSFVLGSSLASFFSFCAGRYSSKLAYEINLVKEELEGKEKQAFPNDKGLFALRSSCDFCGNKVPLYLNLPVIGWIILRGMTKCCKNKLSNEYILGELWLGIVFVAGSVILTSTSSIIIFCSLAAGTYLIGEIDRKTLTIPLGLIVSLALLNLIFMFYYNIYDLEATICILFVGFLTVNLFSLTKFSNAAIGNGDLYFMVFAFSVLSQSIYHMFFFLLFTSLGYFCLFMRGGDDENPMGFTLHFGLIAVLLHHLN